MKQMLYVTLRLKNGATMKALVDSRFFVSAIAKEELDRFRQKATAKNFKIEDTVMFQIQVVKSHLEKLFATATLKFDSEDQITAQHVVVINTANGPITGLHLLRHNSVVNDTTHGVFYFHHLTMQVKSTAIDISSKHQTGLVQDSLTIPPMTIKMIHPLLISR